MPRTIDHQQRRAELAEAVWRLVLEDGVAAASVRRVAGEARVSMGSVRHFFDNQDELLHFAMREVMSRARDRVQAGAEERHELVRTGAAVEAGARLLEEVLPLDDDRLAEARIWLAFTTRGHADPTMASIRKEADEAVRQLCRDTVLTLAELGAVHGDRGSGIEIERLWSLLDGLTLHLLVAPERTQPASASRLVRYHLRDLRTPPDGNRNPGGGAPG